MSEQYPQPYPQMPQQAPPKKPKVFLKVLLAVVIGGILLMGGCVALVGVGMNEASKEAEKVTATQPTEGDAPYDTPADDATPPAVPDPTPAPEPDDQVAKVGATQWFTYEDGLKVQVTKLTKFTISDVAAGGKAGGTGVIVTVTIKNTGTTKLDASMASVEMATGPNGDTAESVYDSKFETGFKASIPAGRTGTAKFGFAVPKAHLKQLLIEVTPSFEHTGAAFEGSVK